MPITSIPVLQMKFDSPVSLVLDFETLDKKPTAAITQIGIIAVRRKTFKVIEQLELLPHVIPQLAAARTFSVDTIQWAEKKNLLPGPPSTLPLEIAVKILHAFISFYNPFRIWAWGKDFERPLLENLASQYQLEFPDYQFRKFACARQEWQNAFGMESPPPDRTHHALQDTLDELRDLRSALKKLNITHRF
jgi:hypothetical protein